MRIDLRGKRALVVGGSRGIGAELARTLAGCGASLCLTYESSEEQAAAVAAEIARAQGEARALQADAASWDAAHEIVGETQPDLLVYCAGMARDSMIWKTREADFDQVMSVNLKGIYGYVKAAATHMRHRGYGRVVAISSINAARGKAGQSVYAASKSGLEACVRSVAIELGPRGVTVNAVAPGWVDTDMTAAFSPQVRERALSQSKTGRLGTPADVAPLVAFLCSEFAGHITGQVIAVDGGQLLG